MNRRSFLHVLGAGGTVAVGAGLAGCTSSGASSAENEPVNGILVEMTDSSRFEPETVEIPAGETVAWRNVGAVDHTVTAYEEKIPADAAYFASGGFESEQAARDGDADGTGEIEGGDEYKHTFKVSGRYEYFCIPHESMGMKGTVIVT